VAGLGRGVREVQSSVFSRGRIMRWHPRASRHPFTGSQGLWVHTSVSQTTRDMDERAAMATGSMRAVPRSTQRRRGVKPFSLCLEANVHAVSMRDRNASHRRKSLLHQAAATQQALAASSGAVRSWSRTHGSAELAKPD
jgi:hypothetical protein